MERSFCSFKSTDFRLRQKDGMKILLFLILILWGVAKSYAAFEPNSHQIQALNIANRHFLDRQYGLAEAEYKSLLKQNPNDSVATFNLALTKYRQGAYLEAIKYFNNVTAMHTFYRGPAFYYLSISQLNLGQNVNAAATVKRYKNANLTYKPMQTITETLETGSDEHYENAKLAAAQENYELCLLEINQSVLTDTNSGRELITKCIVEIKRTLSKDASQIFDNSAYYKLYFDSAISQSDNIYQRNKNPLTGIYYSAEFGSEYLIRDKIDFGLGFNYNQTNSANIDRFKIESFRLNIPTYYRISADYFGASPFYELNRSVDLDSYSDAGISLFYSHLDKKNYRLGVQGTFGKRTSLSSAFDYKTGAVNSVRFFVSRFLGNLSILGSLTYDQNHSGDIKMGLFQVPYSNDAMTYSLEAAYDFDRFSVLKLKYILADKDFVHIVSPNNTDRQDKIIRAIFTYHYAFSKNFKAFLQRSLVDGNSNYDVNEIINKNFSENVTLIGFSLLTY